MAAETYYLSLAKILTASKSGAFKLWMAWMQDHKNYWEKEAIDSDIDIHYAITERTFSYLLSIIKKSANILDVGCGGGTLLYTIAAFSQKNSRIFGLDYSVYNCLRLQAFMKTKVSVINGDASKIPLKNNFFDLVTSTMLIEHLSNPTDFINELRRISKGNGFILISSVIKKKGTFYIYKNSAGNWALDPTHKHEYETKEEFLSQFRKEDFEILYVNVDRLRFSPFDFLFRKLFSIFHIRYLKSLAPKMVTLRKITEIPIPAYSIEVIIRRVDNEKN